MNDEGKEKNTNLYTVRIMGVNLGGSVVGNEMLVVSTLQGADDEMKNIRVYLHESSFNSECLWVANEFWKSLVKYRLKAKKKVLTKHLYNTYREVQNIYKDKEKDEQYEVVFKGITRTYIKRLNAYRTVLRRPRANYIEVKSDTFRLFMIDKAINDAKETIKEIKESEKGEKNENE